MSHLGVEAGAVVSGEVDPGFVRVQEVFQENFAEREELGAAVSVWHDGRKVVDIWGGWCDPMHTKPWNENTIVCMMSIAKGMTALCAHILIERGRMELEAPVAEYWPAFAQAGKAAITVRQLIGHHAAMVYPDNAPDGSYFDWHAMVEALAAKSPDWEPGSLGAYHSSTYGYLIGELIRQVDGRTPGLFFREEIAEPLQLDYHIGLSEDELARVADIVPNPGSATYNARQDPTTNLGRAWRALPPVDGVIYNDHRYRTRELPSSNGHGNARAVAKLYALLACGGKLGEKRLFLAETVARIAEQQWDNVCGLTGRRYRMGLGLFLNTPEFAPMGPNPQSFGHIGAGGALGFADPDGRLSFSYCSNYMCSGAATGERCGALVEATYACL